MEMKSNHKIKNLFETGDKNLFLFGPKSKPGAGFYVHTEQVVGLPPLVQIWPAGQD